MDGDDEQLQGVHGYPGAGYDPVVPRPDPLQELVLAVDQVDGPEEEGDREQEGDHRGTPTRPLESA